MASDNGCPACGAELFGWLQLAAPGGSGQVLMQRCERCGLGIAASAGAETATALFDAARDLPDGRRELAVANRDSIQARLGSRYWAALEPERLLYPTPAALSGLAASAGFEIDEIRFPRSARAHTWMWQTLLNALTFNRNFAQELRAGRLSFRAHRVRFAIDALVTTLAAIPLGLISLPLELIASWTRRGGELVAIVSRSRSDAALEERPAPTARVAVRALLRAPAARPFWRSAGRASVERVDP